MPVRSGRLGTFACAVAMGWALLGAAEVTSAASAPPPPDPVIARADTLMRAGRPREAVAYLDRVIAESRASGAHARERAALVKRGLTNLYFMRDAVAAFPDGARAETLSRAARDTAHWCAALRIQGISKLELLDFPKASKTLQRLEALARAFGNKDDEGIALSGLGYIDLEQDRDLRARARYRAALACLATTRQRFYWIEARTGLARSYTDASGLDSARAIYREVAREARAMGLVTQASHAWNNLGVIEWSWGDPANAAEYWDRAIALMRLQNARHEMVTPTMHRALALLALGRIDEGARVVEGVMDSLWDVAPVSEQRMILANAGLLRMYQDRPREAIGYFDRFLALADSGDGANYAEMNVVATRLGRAHLESGDPAAGLDAIRRVRTGWSGAGGPSDALGGAAELDLLLALDRPRDALARLDVLEPQRAGKDPRGEYLSAHMVEIHAWNALGDRSRARAASTRAVRSWEGYRSTSKDPAWREVMGRSRRLALMVADLALTDPAGTPASRARAAFDAVQPFRARTLSERMSGTSAAVRLPSTLRADSLQRFVLEPGEVYLEFHVGPDRTLLLALTRSDARAVWLTAGDLAARTQRFYDLVLPALGGPASDAAVVNRAASGLGTVLFDGVADLLPGARRVLISPDGPLCGLPYAMLRAPGDERALLERAEVAVIPSAAVLAAARNRARAVPPREPTLFALAGSHDGKGNPLRGAAREVDWLEREFERVSAPPASSIGTLPAMRDAMARADVIHLAAHTMVDDRAPWRSGVSLLPPPNELVLHASDVARMRLPARLTVLAGCRTIGTRLAFGEGPQGLATGFLAAGVPATVATLWQVDDERTIEFSRRLYDRLATGLPAGTALREAQLETQRDAKGRHPFVWAAFTLLGDPSAKVPLVERRASSGPAGRIPFVTDGRAGRLLP